MNAYLTLRRASHASSVAVAVLIAVNAIPLVGVLVLGWDLLTLVAVYWAENGVVGLFAVGRIVTAGRVFPAIDGRRRDAALTSPQPPPPPGAAAMTSSGPVLAGMVAFFCVHYGVFWFVHGIFVWVVLPMLIGSNGAYATFVTPDDPLRPFVAASGGGLPDVRVVATTSVFLVISHGVSFVANWLFGGEHLTSTAAAETGAPYARVMVLHMTILLGAFGVALFGVSTAALFVLVVLKTTVDLGAHLAERRRAAARASRTPSMPVPEGLDAPSA